MTLESLTEFFGWMTVINIGLITLSAFMLIVMKQPVTKIHAKLTGLDPADLHRAYFQFLAQYKIALWVFNLTPYIALKIMG